MIGCISLIGPQKVLVELITFLLDEKKQKKNKKQKKKTKKTQKTKTRQIPFINSLLHARHSTYAVSWSQPHCRAGLIMSISIMLEVRTDAQRG